MAQTPFHTLAFPDLYLTISWSRAAPGAKAAGPDAAFPSLLETNSTFFLQAKMIHDIAHADN